MLPSVWKGETIRFKGENGEFTISCSFIPFNTCISVNIIDLNSDQYCIPEVVISLLIGEEKYAAFHSVALKRGELDDSNLFHGAVVSKVSSKNRKLGFMNDIVKYITHKNISSIDLFKQVKSVLSTCAYICFSKNRNRSVMDRHGKGLMQIFAETMKHINNKKLTEFLFGQLKQIEFCFKDIKYDTLMEGNHICIINNILSDDDISSGENIILEDKSPDNKSLVSNHKTKEMARNTKMNSFDKIVKKARENAFDFRGKVEKVVNEDSLKIKSAFYSILILIIICMACFAYKLHNNRFPSIALD